MLELVPAPDVSRVADARRPHLLIAVHSAKRAGAQLVALGQAVNLKRDHELLIAIEEGELCARFRELGPLVAPARSLPIWGAPRWRWALAGARTVRDALRLARTIRRHGIDAVVVNSTVLVAPVIAARIAGVPVIVHAQEAPKSVAALRLFRIHGLLADTVVAIAPAMVKAFGRTRARVILNPVGIALPPPPARRLRAVDARVRLIVVGTIDRHKRQDLAVEALAQLIAAGVDAELELVGLEADAAYAQSLRELAARRAVADRLTFAGEIDDVPARLHAADMLLLPSGEVTPLVLMEAMARGTPVVAARMGSVADVVGEDGTSGLLVEPDDAAAMAAAAQRIAADPRLAAQLATGGRVRVERLFDERRAHDVLRAELRRSGA